MSSSICPSVFPLRSALRSSRIAFLDNTTFERLRFSLMTLASISRPRKESRFRTGRTSTWDPGRNAAMPSISTRRPPFIRSMTRPFIGIPSLKAFSRSSQARSRTASARDSNGKPSLVSMFLTSTSTSSPAFTEICPSSMNSFGLTMPSDL